MYKIFFYIISIYTPDTFRLLKRDNKNWYIDADGWCYLRLNLKIPARTLAAYVYKITNLKTIRIKFTDVNNFQWFNNYYYNGHDYVRCD